ncbi:DUF362 domain-containing protein [Acetanaerobacterium elongatum]|uniref:DUF362 domain-containing protein n=1 Tax=Acetanaerobacterium elongatum TaxID=258515 RepID=A0A1H0CH86_9FIRM|nr:DUF362 domain-containing protein [Acetanaerobacterium elongatum]SDN57220.1 protein of unknown function [Acetanaerobacterium elongatum]
MRKVIDTTIKNQADMKAFLENFKLGSEGVIIKPNWTSGDYGFYTDVESLEPLLAAIDGKKYIIESYMYGRTDNTRAINGTNGLENWDWLKEQDEQFLHKSGMAELLKKYDAEYINITEEYWSGRVAKADEIQQLTESKYAPISHKELYGMIPEKLFQLRHLPLISYAKIKYNVPAVSIFASLSMKNMFGTIPIPNREHYHGSDFDTGLSRSIVDILTVYKSLLRVVGICEGLYHIPVTREEGKNRYKMLWTEYDVIENLGLILGSEDLVTLDAYINKLIGLDPEKRSILQMGDEVFGKWDRAELNYISEDRLETFR